MRSERQWLLGGNLLTLLSIALGYPLTYPWLTINNPNIDWQTGEIIVKENSSLPNQLESSHDLVIDLIPRKNQ